MVSYSNVKLSNFSVLSECHILTFLNFQPVPSPVRLGTEPRRRMPASAGGHGRGRCRGDIAGAQGQGKLNRDCWRSAAVYSRV
ncbi:unnamed protein product [Staurois parvus]|uniref:Uncharacterized protein n=1 Tax=Staurois parvus TaxID=386267 RepID=A0ABN9AX27_9NEOB|nr:unnamed protein product [Staurois parvus]